MKYTLKSPCQECPFRKDALRGYLGPETGNPPAFVNPAAGRIELQPGVFIGCEPADTACHMDIDRAIGFVKKEFGLDEVDASELEGYGVKLQHCAGALLFLVADCKLPHDREKVAAMDRLKAINKPGIVLGSVKEFVAHHTVKPAKKEKTTR